MPFKWKRTIRLRYFHEYALAKARQRESSPHMGGETLTIVQNLDRHVNGLPA